MYIIYIIYLFYIQYLYTGVRGVNDYILTGRKYVSKDEVTHKCDDSTCDDFSFLTSNNNKNI